MPRTSRTSSTPPHQIGFDPIWFSDANFYDETFADWNANGYADNVYIRSSFLRCSRRTGQARCRPYIDIVERVRVAT